MLPGPLFFTRKNKDFDFLSDFVNKGEDATFATVTCFEPKKPEQQQQPVLAGHGFTHVRQRFMLKMSKPSRRETGPGGQGLQQ